MRVLSSVLNLQTVLM